MADICIFFTNFAPRNKAHAMQITEQTTATTEALAAVKAMSEEG